MKAMSRLDSLPHRGRQIVLSRHVRVLRETRLKGSQPWRVTEFVLLQLLCLDVIFGRVKYAKIDDVDTHRSNS